MFNKIKLYHWTEQKELTQIASATLYNIIKPLAQGIQINCWPTKFWE